MIWTILIVLNFAIAGNSTVVKFLFHALPIVSQSTANFIHFRKFLTCLDLSYPVILPIVLHTTTAIRSNFVSPAVQFIFSFPMLVSVRIIATSGFV